MRPNAEPQVSVVIPVLNEMGTIRQCLSSIQTQSDAPLCEIVVVDAGSTDGTAEFLESVENVKVMHAHGRPLGYTRQVGLETAQTDRVLFIDADEVASSAWMREHLRVLDRSDASLGPVYPVEQASPTERLFGMLSTLHDIHAAGRIASRSITIFGSGNLGVRKDVGLRLGFDPTLPTAEDGDFAYRFIREGYEVGYSSDAVVYHRMPHSLGGMQKYVLKLSLGSKALMRKHQTSDLMRLYLESAVYPLTLRFFRRVDRVRRELLPHALAYGILNSLIYVVALAHPTDPSRLHNVGRRGKD